MVPTTTENQSAVQEDAITASIRFDSLGNAQSDFEKEVGFRRTKTDGKMRTNSLTDGRNEQLM